MSELRKARKEAGLCIQCGSPMDREGICCTKCNDANNKSKFKLTKRMHEEKKCTNCGQPMDREGWFCSECVKKMRFKARQRNAERREKGLCVQCGTPTQLGSYCQRCLDMRMGRYWEKKGIKI